ncbi:MAG TPA: NTP transferase domain-containing protein [Kofleriaceae bacterium]|nr:NTP transferase domain-containing protein [Kofleriaceae bacterium]
MSGTEDLRGPQAAVLAGGLATRMLPRTQTVPKALLEVAGRPFVDWQLELLAARGIREVVICIAHLGNLIRDHVGDGARHGVRVTWSEEPPGQLLGTAGALRAALPHLAPRFVVTYGDSYLPFDHGAPLRVLAAHDDCDGVMAIYRNQGRWDESNVITDGSWVTCYAKGMADPRFDHIDYGATALRREVIAALPAGKRIGLDEIQSQLAAAGRLRSVVARDRFFEIGSPAGLAELDHHLRASS